MDRFSTVRATLLLTILGVGLAGMCGRVVWLQTIARQQLIRSAERQQHRTEILSARRGSIFDRNGIMLAGTIQTHGVFLDPQFMLDHFQSENRTLNDMDAALRRLSALIDRSADELADIVAQRHEARFVKVAENLDDRQAEAVRRLNIEGVGTFPMGVRYYPMGSVAAHVLGGVGREGKGLEGLEMKYDSRLSGRPGYWRPMKDARRRPIGVTAEDYVPPVHGQHLVLTLDANIQMIAEQELSAACRRFRADRGEIVVMDPHTGDVLALANWPTFNPQNLNDSPPAQRRNRCLTDPYEPGSTIKPFIVGPALMWGVTRPQEVWPIPGKSYRSRYRSKPIVDVHHYGPLATWDILVKSSNIGMTMLGERLGKARLYQALSCFGFGKPTGIDLPGEDPGLLNPLPMWRDYSIPSVSQGYEVMVTPIQLARGFCVYANGGRLVRPRVVKGALDCDGAVVAADCHQTPAEWPQALESEAADQIRRILCDVPVRGTATKAQSKYWNIFGKTGTAHVSRGSAGYDEAGYTSSFMGGAPAENPRMVVAVIVHEPRQDLGYYGGTVSAPVALRVIERTLSYLDVPNSPQLELPPPAVASVLTGFDEKAYRNRTAVARE